MFLVQILVLMLLQWYAMYNVLYYTILSSVCTGEILALHLMLIE